MVLIMCQSHNIIVTHTWCPCVLQYVYYWIGNRHSNLNGSEASNGVNLIGFWAVHTDIVYGSIKEYSCQLIILLQFDIVTSCEKLQRSPGRKICSPIELQNRCYFKHQGHLTLRPIFIAVSILHLNTRMSHRNVFW